MFKENMIHGKGIFLRKNGEQLNGIWNNNRLVWIIWITPL